MKLPYWIEIERMVPWKGSGGQAIPPAWSCFGYGRRRPCYERATVRVSGRSGRISSKLCNECAIAFAARWGMYLPGTEPGSTVKERRVEANP